MITYDLFAEREACEPILMVCCIASHPDATGPQRAEQWTALVEGLEAQGRWPEGHDAVLRGPVGVPVLFLDGDEWAVLHG